MKRAIEFAFTEAKRTDASRSVGKGHLLIGLLLAGSAAGGRVLSELGVSVERVRADIERIARAGLDESGQHAVILEAPPSGDAAPWPAMSRQLTSVLHSARELARAEQARTVELDHLVRALGERQG